MTPWMTMTRPLRFRVQLPEESNCDGRANVRLAGRKTDWPPGTPYFAFWRHRSGRGADAAPPLPVRDRYSRGGAASRYRTLPWCRGAVADSSGEEADGVASSPP